MEETDIERTTLNKSRKYLPGYSFEQGVSKEQLRILFSADIGCDSKSIELCAGKRNNITWVARGPEDRQWNLVVRKKEGIWVVGKPIPVTSKDPLCIRPVVPCACGASSCITKATKVIVHGLSDTAPKITKFETSNNTPHSDISGTMK